jgi:hypothetical protein
LGKDISRNMLFFFYHSHIGFVSRFITYLSIDNHICDFKKVQKCFLVISGMHIDYAWSFFHQLLDTLPLCQGFRAGLCHSPACRMVHVAEGKEKQKKFYLYFNNNRVADKMVHCK